MPSDKEKAVYLAGPINKCSDGEAMSWREKAKEVLHEARYETLDPMSRDYRGNEGEFVETIVNGDLQDIQDCNVVLVNAWKPSFGTAMETWEASQHLDKTIVLVAPSDTSPWLKYCADEHFVDITDALHWLTR